MIRLYLIIFILSFNNQLIAQTSRKQGQALIDSLIEVTMKMPDDTFKVINYDKICFNYYSINPEEGIKLAKEGLIINQKLNYPEGEIRLLNTIGVLYMQKSEYPTSIIYYNKAFELASKLDKKMRMANVYGNLAILSKRIGKYYDAIDYNLRSIELYKTFPASQSLGGIARSYGNIASIYQYQGEYALAIEYYQKALLINEKSNSKSRIITVLGNIGNLYYTLEDIKQSIEYAERAIKVAEEIGELDGMATGYLRIGMNYEKLKNYALAEEYYRKSLAIFQKLDNKSAIGVAFGNIAHVLKMRSNNYDEALDYLDNSKSILTSLPSNTQLENLYAIYGELYRDVAKDKNDGNPHKKRFSSNVDTLFNQAISYLEKALSLADSMGEIDNSSNLSLILSDVYLERNNYTLAFEYFKSHVNYRDSIFNDKKIKEFTRSELQYNFTKRQDSLKLENEKKKLSLEKEIELNKLKFEYEKKQAAAKSALEKQELEFEERLKREQIETDFAKKEAIQEQKALKYQAEQDKKDALASAEIKRKNLQRNASITGLGLMMLLAIVFFGQRNRISKEKDKSENLLLNILPYETAQELKTKGSSEAKLIDQVSVLFTDFKGFTSIAEKLSPQELVTDLNICFSEFDKIMEKYGIEKIKTIGDSYMAAGGLPIPNATHASDVVKAAHEIAQFMEVGKQSKIALGLPYFEIRIGIHTGPVVAGIVGIKKFAYDIWGDTVNTASRMESSGEIGKVNVSETTYELVKNDFSCEYRGEVEAKGKGLIKMYFVNTPMI